MPERISKLTDIIRNRPDLPGSTTVLARARYPYEKLPTEDMRRLGFLPSIVAVPEAGQSSLVTWRHPESNLHFHRHNDKWIYHEDEWPSFSMVLENLKNQGITNPYRHIITQNPGILRDVALHGIVEGLPGYNNYLAGRILGRTTFSDQIKGNVNPRTNFDKLGRTALISALAGLPMFATGNARLGGALSGGILGFTGAQALGRNLSENQFFVEHPPATTQWAISRTLLGGVLPLLGAGLGARKGYKFTDWLLEDDKKKKDKNEESE